MITPDHITQIQDHVASATSILVILGPRPKGDQVLTAVSLVQTFQVMGKAVELVCPEEVDLQSHGVMGEVVCRQKLGNQNLSVSFDYDEASVDKVSYHIDEDQRKFFLIIKPQKGQPPLKTESVSFDYTGADADLVFLVGVHQYESLEHLYEGYEDMFSNATVVTIHTFEPSIGNLKLNVSGSSSMAESMATVIFSLVESITPDIATNLLTGIEQATDHLQSLTATAQTFEMVATLMKQGARRLRQSQKPEANPSTQPVLNKVEGLRMTNQKENKNEEVMLRPDVTKKTPFAAVMSTKPARGKPARNASDSGGRPAASEPQPGDLNYQPSGFGPGGAG